MSAPKATKVQFSTKPPEGIYQKARDMFGVDFRQGAVFTVGNVIHSNKFPLSADLYQHELVHVEQQTTIGAEIWWERFFTDIYFRYSQETEAYRAQYKFLCSQVKDRNKRFYFANSIVNLMKTMYGFDTFDRRKIMDDLTKNIK